MDGTGVIYQCYVTEATRVGERYVKQRDKTTKDLGKLVAKSDRVASLLGDNVMGFWALVVPICDSKELIIFARAKEQEIRSLSLPFLADAFRIVILTDDDFAAERIALDQRGISTVPTSQPLDEQKLSRSVADLKAAEPDQVASMDDKLGRARVLMCAGLRERLLRQIVDADNIREHLRVGYPSTSELVLTQLAVEERAILQERDFNLLHRIGRRGARAANATTYRQRPVAQT